MAGGATPHGRKVTVNNSTGDDKVSLVETEMVGRPRGSGTGAPPDAIRREFAKRLQDLLNDRGWVQAELARRMAPYLKDSRIGRDNISKYVRGKVLPLPPALEAMAKVFGVEAKDILPTRGREATDIENVPSSLQDIGGDMYWVRVNLALPADDALDIMRRVREALKKTGKGQ